MNTVFAIFRPPRTDVRPFRRPHSSRQCVLHAPGHTKLPKGRLKKHYRNPAENITADKPQMFWKTGTARKKSVRKEKTFSDGLRRQPVLPPNK
ncbi:hypothetical protein [Kingella potus]|uniref:hypothetical protein n=1 Tax=Kingella potus TaxID=265175 RepID=UPI001FD47C95|nr:hypothetical protein [Kingella potus]UOP01675.1 hypothetical protein LVJ84_05910 [Kingella potus]